MLDHARYMRNREERLAKNRQYYREHRYELLAKKKIKDRERLLRNAGYDL